MSSKFPPSSSTSSTAAAVASWPPGTSGAPTRDPVSMDGAVRKITSSIQHQQAVQKMANQRQASAPVLLDGSARAARQPPQIPLTRPSSQQSMQATSASSAVPQAPASSRVVPPRPAVINKPPPPPPLPAVLPGRSLTPPGTGKASTSAGSPTISTSPNIKPTSNTDRKLAIAAVATLNRPASQPQMVTKPILAAAEEENVTVVKEPSPAAATQARKSLFATVFAMRGAGSLSKRPDENGGDSRAHKDFVKQLLSVHVSPENAERYTLALFKEGFDHKSKIQFLEEQDLLHCGITSRGDIKAILSLVVDRQPRQADPMQRSDSKSIISSAANSNNNSSSNMLVVPVQPTPRVSSAYTKHVMLSFNVSTLGAFANLLHAELMRNKKTHCWSCTQSIQVGQEWRDSIQVAVEQCTHFVMLINAEWINSGECQHEYKIALSLYNKTKQPKMYPIVFPSARKHLESGMGLGIAANFNCVFLEDEDAREEGRQPAAVRTVIDLLN